VKFIKVGGLGVASTRIICVCGELIRHSGGRLPPHFISRTTFDSSSIESRRKRHSKKFEQRRRRQPKTRSIQEKEYDSLLRGTR
jgi:hypothetical protein